MTSSSESAPAKINLFFHITGQRDDGYHFIDSVVTFLDLADTLSFTESSRDEIVLAGAFAKNTPAIWHDNLVGKAVDFFRTHIKPTPLLSIQIDKKIPSGAGLGGGSADAAACLRFLQRTYAPHTPIDPAALAVLGADVPMCFIKQSAQVSGIGEKIVPLAAVLPWSVVLVKPPASVSTIDAYTYYKKTTQPFHTPSHVTADNIAAVLQKAGNDLQTAAIHLCPGVQQTLDALERTHPVIARMTGSGSCCFGLYEKEEEAESAHRALAQIHPDWWITPARFLS